MSRSNVKVSGKGNNKTVVGNKTSKIFKITVLIILPILLIAYLSLSYFYKGRLYLNTFVNGIDASNKSVDEIKEEMNNQITSYVLTIEGRNGITDQIAGSDIDLSVVFDDSIEKLLEDQNGFTWPKYLFENREKTIDTMLDYDEELLKEEFNKLIFFQEEYSIEPTNAHISEFDGSSYHIVPEDLGAKVKEEPLYEKVMEAIPHLEEKISIEEIDGYLAPEITSEYPDLVKGVEDLNKLTSAKITYEFGQDIEVVDGNKISQWVTIDEHYNVSLNPEGVKEFVDHIGKNYNTFGKTRTLKTSYGKTIQISGGDYGWWLNRGAEAEELTELILEGKEVVKEPNYYQKANFYGEDDIGNTYVEVNLTAQHLFFYKDGNLVMESDFVSGNLTKNYGTPTGTYVVQYKERNATLTGETYQTPVDYWIPFNHNIGFHDATWRNKFGEDIYVRNGSHGCINMPHSAAKIMYEHIERGVAVYVYELPGT